MRKRSTELLQRLLSSPEHILRGERLSEEYRISEKTLRNDVQEILDFAREQGLEGAVSLDGNTLRLEQRELLQPLREALYGMDLYSYKLSLEERKTYIIVALTLQEDYYSMQKLADELYVTRNTIINDCKVVEQFLRSYPVSFIARSKKGVRLQGSREELDQLLIDLFCSLAPSLRSENTFFTRFLMKKAGFAFSLTDVIEQMDRFTRENHVFFAKEVFFEIATVLFVKLNRIDGSAPAPAGRPVQMDMMGRMVEYVARALGMTGLRRSDALSIERLILAGDFRPEVQSINDFTLYGVICHFLLEVGGELHVGLLSDDLLVKSLLSHIRSMGNWRSGAFDNRQDYASVQVFIQVQSVAEKKFYILEKFLQYKMTEPMKDSIIIHICAALLRSRDNSHVCSVIVSCPGSMATSKYIEAQLKRYFNLNIVDILTTRQVERAGGQFENVDFIVSTVEIHNSALPVAVVSPLLTLEDIGKLQRMAFQRGQHEPPEAQRQYLLMSRLYSIYQSADAGTVLRLNEELSALLDRFPGVLPDQPRRFALLEMLKQKYIKLSGPALEWRQAIREASADLLRDGYFDAGYVAQAIENVEEFGNYIIVSSGIALAHASREAGVYNDGLSLLLVRDGIRFEDGDTVYLLFFFSQKGDTDYLDLFKEIIKLGKDPEQISRFRQLSDAAAVRRLMEEVLSAD